jgi:hypothetical protein
LSTWNFGYVRQVNKSIEGRRILSFDQNQMRNSGNKLDIASLQKGIFFSSFLTTAL